MDEIVTGQDKTTRQAITKAEIARLSASLADAQDQARAAGSALASSAEEIARLRREKEAAEATALDEFKLRLHMERDRMLSDSTEKALHATIKELRQHVAALQAEAASGAAHQAEMEQALERERAALAELSGMRERLAKAEAAVGALTERCEQLQQRLDAAADAGQSRLSSAWRTTIRIMGRSGNG